MKALASLSLSLAVTFLLLPGTALPIHAAPPPPPAGPQDPETQLGNIFFDNEPVSIQASATGDSVTYSIKDFWGKEVDNGTASVSNGMVSIVPKIKAHGYYELTINPGTDNKLKTFAIIAPIDYSTVADSPFCACSHFGSGWNHDLMPLIPRLGIAQMREDLTWRWVETTQEGVYKWDPRIDSVYSDLTNLGIQILPDAAYCSAKIYDHTEFPTTQRGWDGFAKFCVAALQHYPQLKQIELWNEFNGSWGPPKSTPPDQKPILYTGMEKTVYAAVKQSNPDVEVLGGAMVRVPLPYMESLFKAGALDSLDAVVVHPYIGQPEVFWRTLNSARDLMKKYNNGQEKPIYATEFSWGNWSTRDPMQHAEFLVRGSVIMAADDVKRMFWFELRDSPLFPNGQCLVHSDTDPRGKYSPTPSAVAMATLIRVLHDEKYEDREAVTPLTRTWVFRFHNAQGQIRACWFSGDGTSQITLNADAPLTKVDIMGNETQVAPENGKITLTLNEEPFFLKGSASNVQEVPTQWKTIANSVDDASDTQGNNGWHPGFFPGTAPGQAPDSIPSDSFQEMTLHTDNWGYRWNGPGDCRVSDSSDLWTNKANMPSIRWVSTMDGKITLRGSFWITRSNKDAFQNFESGIYVNGKQVFAKETPTPQPIPGHIYSEPFEVPVDVKTGDVIDFVVPQSPTGANHPRVDASICVPNPDFHS